MGTHEYPYTSIPTGTHTVGTHKGTGQARVSYYPYPWVPIDIPSCNSLSFLQFA